VSLIENGVNPEALAVSETNKREEEVFVGLKLIMWIRM
jgi:hypothetical protein